MSKLAAQRRLRARVYGRVQGVGYRQFAARAAVSLGLGGYARNEERDGSVEVVAEGPRPTLETLLERLGCGPLLSRVAHVEATWEDSSGSLGEFRIRE